MSMRRRLIWQKVEMIHTSEHYIVKPCRSCPLAGYLIVNPLEPASSLSDLPEDALLSLGPTLAKATGAIEAIVRPERVYCALFSEETCSVHFRLFPRTTEIAAQFAVAHPAETQLSGSLLLDWARRTFHSTLTDDYEQTVEAIFRELNRKV
jgi:diadenosine tetraphosphate (Ap4A) HIT family hydrolase